MRQLPQPWRDKMLPLCNRVGAYIAMQYKLLRIAQDAVENLQMDVRYLLFDVEYASELIRLGEQDASSRKDELEELLANPSAAPAREAVS